MKNIDPKELSKKSKTLVKSYLTQDATIWWTFLNLMHEDDQRGLLFTQVLTILGRMRQTIL